VKLQNPTHLDDISASGALVDGARGSPTRNVLPWAIDRLDDMVPGADEEDGDVHTRRAITMLELLILLAILAAMSVLVMATLPHQDFARAFAARVAAARLEAIATGREVSLTIRPCVDTVAVPTPDEGVLRSFPPRGLLFTPDGLPRTCDGGGVGNTTILLEYRGRQAAVIVSSLGRVRWEMR
jgi:hypothetical protein